MAQQLRNADELRNTATTPSATSSEIVSTTTARPRAGVLESGGRYFETRLDSFYGVLWVLLTPDCPPRFTRGLVEELRRGQAELAARIESEIEADDRRIHYQVFGSRIPGVFSLGGDLELFRELIAARDRDRLLAYALECVDVVYTNTTSYHLPITTISLVQGDALGGGFEAALAADVIVAERGCKMGLPEILFNLFPGMGAYQLLARRMAPVRAERLIRSGRLYLAEELHEMGIVDVLADPGAGEEAVRNHVRNAHRQLRGRQALRRAIESAAPVDRDGMRRMAEHWADAALELTPRDLDVVDYLVRAQARRFE